VKSESYPFFTVIYFTVWLVPVVAYAVLSTPDDGCKGHPKYVESEIK
jgi:hypothetical protein